MGAAADIDILQRIVAAGGWPYMKFGGCDREKLLTAEVAEKKLQSALRRTSLAAGLGFLTTRRCRIGAMSGRVVRVTSRIVFFLCGLISLFTGAPYAMLQGAELPVQSEWVIFVAVLGLVGVFSVTVAVLPRSWIAKAYRKDRDDERLFSAPLKLLGAFAAIFYVVALVAYLAPHGWNLNSQLMFTLCPMYFLKMTFDPSLVTVFFLLAPMNAAVYGALGLTLGYVWLRLRRRNSG